MISVRSNAETVRVRTRDGVGRCNYYEFSRYSENSDLLHAEDEVTNDVLDALRDAGFRVAGCRPEGRTAELNDPTRTSDDLADEQQSLDAFTEDTDESDAADSDEQKKAGRSASVHVSASGSIVI